MSLQSIISSAIKVPGLFVEVTLGVGAQSPSAGGKKVLLFGNKLSAGTATVEEVVAVTSPDQARTLFGAGSELFLACVAALAAYPAIQLFAIPIAEAGTAADADLAFTGTATEAGSVLVEVLDKSITVEIEVGDTATDVATNVAAAVNDETDWPVSGSSATGTATLTAKNTGTRGNLIWHRVELTAASGITFTDVSGYLAGGATADDPQNALDASAVTRYHYLVAPYQDATALADFDTQVTDLEAPLEAKRARFIWGSIDTLANTTTVATGINNARGQCVWHYNAKQTPLQLAATAAAEMAEVYESDPAYNTDGLRMRGIVPQHAEADAPTFTEQNSALNNGITPLAPQGNSVVLVRAVTNRSQDASGNPDYRVLDVHYVEVSDWFADAFEQNFPTRFANNKLGVDVEGEVPDPGVATPETIKDWIFGILSDEENDKIVNVEARASELVVEADADTPGRVNASVPLDVIELLHQGGFDVRQVG